MISEQSVTKKLDQYKRHLSDFQPEQAERIHQIHDQLINNLEHRISIETLSKQYLMNPTTLKNMFKSIYGTSIAAHIREHRMEYAAQLLQNSNLSIADIASKVGYDSQSRFSSAFKKQYKMLPKEYRKNSDIS
ncbi:MAG: helix-turn-helix transcriptional regulator [Blautia hansenii]